MHPANTSTGYWRIANMHVVAGLVSNVDWLSSSGTSTPFKLLMVVVLTYFVAYVPEDKIVLKYKDPCAMASFTLGADAYAPFNALITMQAFYSLAFKCAVTYIVTDKTWYC